MAAAAQIKRGYSRSRRNCRGARRGPPGGGHHDSALSGTSLRPRGACYAATVSGTRNGGAPQARDMGAGSRPLARSPAGSMAPKRAADSDAGPTLYEAEDTGRVPMARPLSCRRVPLAGTGQGGCQLETGAVPQSPSRCSP